LLGIRLRSKFTDELKMSKLALRRGHDNPAIELFFFVSRGQQEGITSVYSGKASGFTPIATIISRVETLFRD
jgi:hypothetical protein